MNKTPVPKKQRGIIRLQQLDVIPAFDVLHRIPGVKHLFGKLLDLFVIKAGVRGADNHNILLLQNLVRQLLEPLMNLALMLVFRDIGVIKGPYPRLRLSADR